MQVSITLHFWAVGRLPLTNPPLTGMSRYRNVCFTWNNPEGLIEFDEDKMDYLVYQEEIGESGTYHFQGYCEFKNKISLNPAKALLGGATVHLERRRGTALQASAYAKKDDTRVTHTTPYEFGELKEQGKRNDLEAFKDAVLTGGKKRTMIDEFWSIFARHPKFYDTLTMLHRPKRTTELVVSLLIGDTGTGKTRYVMDHYGEDPDFYVIPISNGTMWYDAYDGHTKVLLDDFGGASSHVSLCSLLRMLDRYPVLVPTKGGHTWWMPDEVFVTTNILPQHWYKWENRGEQYKALARRFNKVLLYYVSLPGTHSSYVLQEPIWWEENKPNEAIY